MNFLGIHGETCLIHIHVLNLLGAAGAPSPLSTEERRFLRIIWWNMKDRRLLIAILGYQTHTGELKKKRGDGNHCRYNKRHISITLTQTCFNIMSIWNVLVRLTEMFLWKMVDILLLSRRSHGRPDTEVTKQTSAPNSSASSVSSHSRILLAARKAQP